MTGEEEVRAPPALVYATSDTNSLIYLYTGKNKYCWTKMAMGLFSKVVSDKMSGKVKAKTLIAFGVVIPGLTETCRYVISKIFLKCQIT